MARNLTPAEPFERFVDPEREDGGFGNAGDIARAGLRRLEERTERHP